MKYYRCKCGKSQSYGSMSPLPCKGCEKCGTTLALGPEGHRKPEPHVWIKKYNETTGKPYEICSRCHKKNEIDNQELKIQGKTIRITPQCVINQGNPGVVDYAFGLMRDEITQAIKNMPESDFEISFFRIKKGE